MTDFERTDLSTLNPDGYDGVEVSPVIYVAEHDIYAVVSEDYPNPDMWTVYLHCVEGGVESISDYPTKLEAYAFAEECQQWLGDNLKYHTDWS